MRKELIMKLIYLIFLFPLTIVGQEITLTGLLQTNQHQPIQAATISLLDHKSKQFLGTALSNEHGFFSTTLNAQDSIVVEITHLGYENYSSVFAANSADRLIITLQAKIGTLEEVSVIAKPPMITRKVDRLIFQVEESLISSLSSWEILKKTPLVSAQGSTLSVRGNPNIKVLINDKPIMLSGEDLKVLLESNNGSDIKRIEVITNPPAKYDASNAAIINIIMKSNSLFGYKGVVTGRHTQSNYAKELIGISNFYRSDKWNFKLNYNFISGTYARYGTDYIFYPEDQTQWKTTLNRINHAKRQSSYSFAVDYLVDTTLTLSFGIDGFYDPNTAGYYQAPTSISDKNGNQISSYDTYNDHIKTRNNKNFYLQLSKKWTENKKMDWTSYVSLNENTHWQDILTQLNFHNMPKDTSHFSTNNQQTIQMYASQLDFSDKWKHFSWEYGAKYSFVKTQSDLQFDQLNKGKNGNTPDQDNLFNYQEHTLAAYLSSEYTCGNWQWKGGLRLEQTMLKGITQPENEFNKQSYLNVFPSIYIQHDFKKAGQLGFSYGKRIERPSYSWLNPAKSYFNLFSYFQGDPNLRATLGHNLNLNYTVANWNVDLFYQYEKWPNMEISFQNNQTNELIYRYTNIRKRDLGGISLNKNFSLLASWSLQTDLMGYYHENQFIGLDQVNYLNHVFSWNGRINSNFVIDQPKNWLVEIGFNFYSPTIQGPFRISSFSTTYLNSSRKFFKERLELSISFLDIFKKEGTKVTTHYADQNNYFLDYGDTKSIVATLKYSFGNQSLQNGKSVKQADERQRF